MRIFFSIVVAVMIFADLFGQVPSSFKYQAVLRDVSGNVRGNAIVNIDVAIMQGSTTGSQVFIETHNVTTNEFGLVNIEIGSKNAAGFSNIDWSAGPYFIKIIVDGTEMGITQLLSVPYALYAKTASDRVTPLHCLTIPFTRMLAGEMDFTPGGFLNDNPADFKVAGGDAPAPHVMGTRCFQLAMMVVYESAFEVFCESPDNVRNQAGSDFLKGLPASWDETRVLMGMPGEYIVVARKSGDAWYIGGMSVLPREISIRLDFLDDMEYRGVSWTYTPDAAKNPRKVSRKEFDAGRTSTLNFTIAANGGFTAILSQTGK